MLTNCHPINGFDGLIAQMHKDVLYTNFANQPLEDHDIVDIATQVAIKSGMFSDTYKE